MHTTRASAVLAALLLFTAVHADEPDWDVLPLTTHAALQAVDADGFGTFPLSTPIKLRGVILNHADNMLDTAPFAPAFLGGQWQVYVQATSPDDFGGTAVWMGQLYGNLPFTPPNDSYDEAQWLAEVDRVGHDPFSGAVLLPGDLVEIRARAPGLHFHGKSNVNEQHTTDPANDFDVVLVEAGHGLPQPEVLSLSAVKDGNDAFLFDPTRATGCERYQGTLVRFNDVWLADPENWGSEGSLTITDGERTFPLRLGRDDGFTDFPAPTGTFDVVGILDQEDVTDTDGYRGGYRLWVTWYDGNGVILPTPWYLPGDSNCDGRRNWRDIDYFVAAQNDDVSAWEAMFAPDVPRCPFANNDVNGNGHVDWRDIDPFVAVQNR